MTMSGPKPIGITPMNPVNVPGPAVKKDVAPPPPPQKVEDDPFGFDDILNTKPEVKPNVAVK